MPRTPRRVFISYTAEDLVEFADRVVDVVRLMQWIAIDHRDWAPNGLKSVPLCRQQVKDADIVVMLVAQRYGWIPPLEQGGDGETSITQLEYRWAREFGKPVVLCLLADKVKNWPPARIEWHKNPRARQPLDAFRAELRQYAAAFFTADPASVTEKLQLGLQSAETLISLEPQQEGDQPVSRPAAAVSKRPEGLPYLCNRSEQSRQFERTMQMHLKADRPRPLLFVIHGDADEAHPAFLQRLTGHLLPRVLGEAAGSAQFKTLELEKIEPSAQASFANELRAELANKLLQPEFADDRALVAYLQRSRVRGIVPVLQLRASESRNPDSVLLAVHDYWRDFPDLSAQQFAVCLLSVKYDAGRRGHLDRLRTLFSRSGDADERMRAAILALEEEGRGDVRASVYVLPELKGVTRGDVERWLGLVREWLPRRHISDAKHSAMFEGRDSISMDDAIEHMESLLTEQTQKA